jgi:hypothetical protein
MLGRIDDWLIDRVAQPIADRLAHWTTPQALSRSFMIGSAVFACCRAMVKFEAGTLDATDAVGIGIAVSCNLFTAVVMPKETRAGLMPEARQIYRFPRCVGLVFYLLAASVTATQVLDGTASMATLFLSVDVSLFMASMYLAACRNMPPQRRAEAREGKLVPVTVGSR